MWVREPLRLDSFLKHMALSDSNFEAIRRDEEFKMLILK